MQTSADAELLRTIYTAELARVRYTLRSYLRERLKKIEAFVMHILDNPSIKARLSPKESQFSEDYFVLIGSHLKQSVARHLPEAFSSLVRQASAHPSKDMVPAPHVDRHVFCRVMEDRGEVEVDEEG
jgi:GINS complex subunit 4